MLLYLLLNKRETNITFLFYNIINHKQILTKYYNHQAKKYYNQDQNITIKLKNTMVEQKLMEKMIELKIVKEKRNVQ